MSVFDGVIFDSVIFDTGETTLRFVDLHDGGPKERKKYKAKQERLHEQIREGFDPKPEVVEAAASVEAVSILPSRTEYVAIHAPAEGDDELAIVMALA